MFVRSIRMHTVKLVAIAALAVLAIATLVLFLPAYESPTAPTAAEAEIRFDKIKTAEDRIAFLSQYGYTVDAEPIESTEVTIPKEFDKVFAAYNALQKKEGLDLGRYRGKTVMRYTYRVTNYTGYDGDVCVSLLIYKNKVIGGDVCSADPRGFAHGLTKE